MTNHAVHDPIFKLNKADWDKIDSLSAEFVESSDSLMRLSHMIANAVQLVVEREMIRQGRLEPMYRAKLR